MNEVEIVKLRPLERRLRGAARRQSGMVLLFTLILVVILLISAIAFVRSSSNTALIAGNLAFKKDLQMQGQRGLAAAETLLKTGALSNTALLIANQPADNYSATMLPSSASGIPTMLLDDALWNMTGSDITDATTPLVDPATGKTWTTGVSIRYVIDRLCQNAGPPTAATCVISSSGQDKGGTDWLKRAGGVPMSVYRITVRVDGPHNSQTFVQEMVAL